MRTCSEIFARGASVVASLPLPPPLAKTHSVSDAMADPELISLVLNPSSDDADALLRDLGLSGMPSREEVHREIEEKLLLPKERLPDHWLPHYQMCACILKAHVNCSEAALTGQTLAE